LGIGGDLVVRGAVAAARQLRVSELLIGIILVGLGTSTPELVTSVNAALREADSVAVGNVVGSNISNVLLIFALAAVAKPIPVGRRALARDGLVMVGVSAAFAAYAVISPEISRAAGLAMMGLLGAYMLWAYLAEARGEAAQPVGGGSGRAGVNLGAVVGALGLCIAGVAALIYGADFLVRGAVALARSAGLSETVIGLTIVAIGTSLPEMVATMAAALRGRAEVAFGNIVGSNLYNILGVLGATAFVHPLAIPSDLGAVDWIAFAGAPALMMAHAATGARVSRWEGALMLSLYGAYIAYLVSGVGR
jgi:cation:H+ antiporter